MKKLILLLFLFVSFISSAQIYSTYFVIPRTTGGVIHVTVDVVVIQSILGHILDVIKLENGRGKVSLLNYPAGVYLINGKRVIKI